MGRKSHCPNDEYGIDEIIISEWGNVSLMKTAGIEKNILILIPTMQEEGMMFTLGSDEKYRIN